MYKTFLSEFDNQYAMESQESATIPDGRYQAQVDKIMFETNSKDGVTVYFKIILKLLSTEFYLRQVTYIKTVNADQIKYIKQTLNTLDINPETFSDVERLFGGALDSVVEIQLKTGKVNTSTGKAYQNVYINKLIAKADGMIATSGEVPF